MKNRLPQLATLAGLGLIGAALLIPAEPEPVDDPGFVITDVQEPTPAKPADPPAEPTKPIDVGPIELPSDAGACADGSCGVQRERPRLLRRIFRR